MNWQQLEDLFHAALERRPEDRSAFVKEACAGDEEMLRKLQTLLAAHDDAGSFIEEGAVAVEAKELAAEQVGTDAGQPVIGQTISHYRIIRRLGAGAMGEVYLAQDTTLRREVALKLLPAHFSDDAERLRRFEQEARAASALNHPNILTIYEIGNADSVRYIATEFIDGLTLRERIGGRPMKTDEALEVAVQVASALAAAHAKGIVHRDIKPENIMISRPGRPAQRENYVKVLDFGIAKLTEPQVPDTEMPTRMLLSTSAGVTMGTAPYMSPEQVRGDRVDARTDIWSLGAVLYELLSGEQPFTGEKAQDVSAAILKDEPLPLPTHVPDGLKQVAKKALRKNREDRYQTAGEMFTELRSLQQTATRGASLTTRPTAGTPYLTSMIRRRSALIALALLITVIGVAAYLAYARFWREHGSANIDPAMGIKSLAVLPFANTGKDPDIEYLCDGISESLTNTLSQLPDVKVIATSSTFAYKDKEVTAEEVGRALRVQAIVTGRIVLRGDQLQITTELVNANDKTQIWGEQYNRKATDLLAVQSEISREIVDRLRLRLTPGERQHLAKRQTVNPQAYELALKGRFYQNKGGVENQRKAVEYFQQAIAVDPAYAFAYAELSVSYSNLVRASMLDAKEFTPQAEAAARQALALDESLAEAHRALAILELDAWNWIGAEREFKRAIELNPNLARAYGRYSLYLSIRGRHDEAIAAANRARELDPLSPQINWVVAARLELARRYDEAIEAAKRAFELDRDNHGLLLVIGHAYSAKGQYREAIAAYQEAIKQDRDSPTPQVSLGVAYAKAGERQQARAILKRLEARKVDVSPATLAVLYVALGDREQAFAALERAYAVHDSNLQFLGVNPGLDPLRSDARFVDLMRRVGLTP